MKQVKKSLTLLLALIMALGLMSVNAGAAKKDLPVEEVKAPTQVVDIEDGADGDFATLLDGDVIAKYTPSTGDAEEDVTAFGTNESGHNLVKNGTYVFQDDVTLTQRIRIEGDVTDVTLDLGGKTLTFAAAAGIDVRNGATVTIKNGTLTYSGGSCNIIQLIGNASTVVTIESDATVMGTVLTAGDGETVNIKGSVTGTVALIANNAKLTIDGEVIGIAKIQAPGIGNTATLNGTVTGEVIVAGDNNKFTLAANGKITHDPSVGDQTGITVWGGYTTANTVDVYGRVEGQGWFALCTNGSKEGGTANAIFNVYENAEVVSDSVAVYLPGGGRFNMTGGYVEGVTGIYNKAAALTISGGTVKAIGEWKNYEYYGNGCNNTGDAIVIDNCGYPHADGSLSASITGGTFDSDHGNAVGSYAYGKADGEDREAVTGFVSGGTFLSEGEADEAVKAYLTETAKDMAVNEKGELVDSEDAATADNAPHKFTLSLQRDDGSYADGDEDGAIEVKPEDEVTYNIVLQGDEDNLDVNGVAFKIGVPDGLKIKTTGEGEDAVESVTVNSLTLVKNAQGVYTYYSATDDNLIKITTKNTDTVIGSIIFVVTDDAEKDDDADNHTNWIKPALTDATLSEQYKKGKVELSVETDKSVETPIYTLTLIPMKANATTGVTEADTSKTLEYKFASGVTLPEAVAIPGYTFQNWKVTDKAEKGTWEQDKTYADKAAIPAGLTGTATLTAQYKEISYTVKFDLDHGYATWETAKDKYTIKDIANTEEDFLQLASEPTRLGYTFEGWKATKTGDSKVAYDWRADAFKGAQAGYYGNVLFTAQWKADNWTATDYGYARSNNFIVLFVLKSDKTLTNILTCNGHPMFEVDATKYQGEFLGTDGATTIAEGDKIYAYITGVSKTGAASRPIFEDEAVDGVEANEVIAYKGDVFADNAVDAGDFGNVNSLLSDKDAFTYSALDVRARLEADMAVKDGGDKAVHYASIDDVKAIAALAGTTITTTP